MTHMRTYNATVLGIAFVLALTPALAFASPDDAASDQADELGPVAPALQADAEGEGAGGEGSPSKQESLASALVSKAQLAVSTGSQVTAAAAHELTKVDKLLSYDQADIDAIGTQERSGHTICCPSYACAFADAVMDGTIHDHEYYTCSCCTWTDWGGGDSSDRCVGSDEELLREAYDQIASGKPTVIHVSWEGGEHWIALIGYENATDPDNLALSNFIALDPWDGALLNAGSKYWLYGDGCEHVSDR